MKPTYENGVHRISNADYHNSEGVSRSMLWSLKRSPYHYWYEYINPDYVKPEPTANLFLGSLVHTLTLEPELFSDEYIIKPELQELPKALKLKDVGRDAFDKNKADREEISVANDLLMDEFNAEAEGKTIVSRETYEQANAMRQAVLSNQMAVDLIYDAKIEHSIFWTDDKTGLQFKSRPDAILGGIVTDLKTTANASYKSFQSSIYKHGYALQAGMAKKALGSIGVNMEKFCFICAEKEPPYATAIYVLDDEAVDFGVEQFDKLAEKLSNCLSTDKWHGYEMQTISLPSWSKFDED